MKHRPYSGTDPVKLRLERIRRRARTHRTDSFNNLFSHLDAELLLWAFEGLEEGKAPGVDGIDVEEYGRGLEARLRSLLDRLHRGEYRPQPSRRRGYGKGTAGCARSVFPRRRTSWCKGRWRRS